MNTTPPSLLARVRDPADAVAWREFDERYRQFLLRFCRRRGLGHADAEDTVQRVFAGLCVSLPKFVYDPQRGRFRDYLFRCTRNAISQWAARPGSANRPLSPVGTEMSAARDADPAELADWEQEWVAHHYRLALATLRNDGCERDLDIVERSMSGLAVAAIAAELGMSESAVQKARQRMRARLEAQIARQIEDEDRCEA